MTPASEETAADTYFSERPRSRSARREFRFLYRGELLGFTVDAGVFSTRGLDPGTALLIEHLSARPADHVLEIGCGWGAVGVAASRLVPEGRVVLTDVNRRAARLARENLARNRATNAEVREGHLFGPVGEERFDLIVSNPPFRAGRALVLELLEHAADHLRPGGRLLLVGKGSQGIRYYQEWLHDHWPGRIEVLGRRSGYRVLEASPRPPVEPVTTAAPSAAEAVKNRTHLGKPSQGRRPARRAERSPEVRTQGAGTGE